MNALSRTNSNTYHWPALSEPLSILFDHIFVLAKHMSINAVVLLNHITTFSQRFSCFRNKLKIIEVRWPFNPASLAKLCSSQTELAELKLPHGVRNTLGKTAHKLKLHACACRSCY